METENGSVEPLRSSFGRPSASPTFEIVAQDGRVVTRLYVMPGEGDAVRVQAEIYPVHAPENNEPQWRFFDFPTRKHAQEFVDEALMALEYLGCSVEEPRKGASPGSGTDAPHEFAA